MLRFSKAKVIVTIAFIVIGLLLAVPSLMSREQRRGDPARAAGCVPSWIVPSRAIVLGLDLQGGSHVLLEVDVQDLMRTPDDAAARRRAPRPARARTSLRRAASSSCRAACRCAFRTGASATALMPKLRELSQPIGNAILGQTGAVTSR